MLLKTVEMMLAEVACEEEEVECRTVEVARNTEIRHKSQGKLKDPLSKLTEDPIAISGNMYS